MYSKYKDADPKDTVKKIRAIFDEIGIQLNCKTEKHIDGVFSTYLTDSECHWRTEGKGTTIEYCEASAYGEAMEHVCTHYAFDISTVSPAATEYLGFERYPDEVRLPMEKLPEISPAVMEDLREPYLRLGKVPSDSAIIHLWKKILKSETTTFTPYFNVNTAKTVLLPDAVLGKTCGTNGGGCGNTPEEAIGHALDEIVERWCKYEIYSKKLTPPEIPDAYLEEKCPELYALKLHIEKNGKFNISVHDASLGRGYPVVCIALIDPENKRYLLNFGCHPQFNIALERCFTEIFQDRKVVPELIERKDMAAWSNFPDEEIMCQRNWIKLLEDDLGLWPDTFFSNIPSWKFEPWPIYGDYSNALGMKSQLNRLLRDNADIYIRNVGFLGFPVYKVFIKGISTSHINFTEAILDEFEIVKNMPSFLNGDMEPCEYQRFADAVFGKDSIIGRLFFYTLTNEEFSLLHSAFLMSQGKTVCAYENIRPWTGKNASSVKRVLELTEQYSTEESVAIASRFSSEEEKVFLSAFFSNTPFESTLAYYGFSSQSKQSMSGKSINIERDAYMRKVKQYMKEHKVNQDDIREIIR